MVEADFLGFMAVGSANMPPAVSIDNRLFRCQDMIQNKVTLYAISETGISLRHRGRAHCMWLHLNVACT
jgi:hypothetical protein